MKRVLKQNAWFLVLLLCTMALLVGLLWYKQNRYLQAERNNTIQSTVQRNNNLVVALEQYAERTIGNADAVVQLVKKEFEHHGRKVAFEALLNGFASQRDAFVAVAICNEKGDVVASNFPLNGRPVNLGDREFFRRQQNPSSESLFIGRPLLSRITGETAIPVSRRLSTATGAFAGVVTVEIKPSAFTRFYGDAKLRPRDIISLVGTDDAITLSRRRGNFESHSEYIGQAPLFQHLKKNTTGNYFAKDVLHGVPTYFSYRKLARWPLVATVGTAEADALADHLRQASLDRRSFWLISLLIFLLTALIAVAVLHRKGIVRQLEANEERYRSIFENSSECILLVRADHTVAAANPAACRLFGYAENESFAEAAQTLDPVVSQALERLQNLGEGSTELQVTGKNGRRLIGEITTSRFRTPAGLFHSVLIIRDRTEQLQLQKKLAAEQKRHQRQLTEQVIQAQERERETIGRELHDNVNQVLTTVKLYLEMAIGQKDLREPLLSKSIGHVMNSINEIRNLSRELSAPTLGTKSLVDSVSALVETVQQSSGLSIEFEHGNYTQHIPMDQNLALYRMVQEQLNNIIKHAGARRVKILLQQNGKATTLDISDDGRGFDPGTRGNGIGLNNILGRAKVFDGDVQVHTAPGKGCRLVVSLPLPAKERLLMD